MLFRSQQADVPARVEAIVRAIVEQGGTYPDVVQFLQQASSHHALSSRLVFDAVAEEDPGASIHEEVSARSREIPFIPPSEDAPGGDGAADTARTPDGSS